MCCDGNQLHTLDYNLNLAANFIARCPSCLHNLLAHFCDLTCAPDQSRFLHVTDTDVVASGMLNLNHQNLQQNFSVVVPHLYFPMHSITIVLLPSSIDYKLNLVKNYTLKAVFFCCLFFYFVFKKKRFVPTFMYDEFIIIQIHKYFK